VLATANGAIPVFIKLSQPSSRAASKLKYLKVVKRKTRDTDEYEKVRDKRL